MGVVSQCRACRAKGSVAEDATQAMAAIGAIVSA